MKIQLENLTFRYKSLGAKPESVLDNIDLEINAGEFLGVVGPSGSGKTTLMQHLTGLLKPDKGRILINGQELWSNKTSLTEIRRKIGLIFQFPETQLFEETVYDDIAFGPRNLRLSEDEIANRVEDVFRNVDLDFVKFKDRSPFHLSDGEKRRVAIAGVLALQPDFLALDEPTAGLDYLGVEAVIKILRNFHAQGKTVLIISHDLDLVASLVRRVVVLKDGRIHFDGTKESIFENSTVLESAGLSVPRTQHVVNYLKRQGLIKTNFLYSIEDIKRELTLFTGTEMVSKSDVI